MELLCKWIKRIAYAILYKCCRYPKNRLSFFDKASIIASVQVTDEDDKKTEREAKRGAKGRRKDNDIKIALDLPLLSMYIYV